MFKYIIIFGTAINFSSALSINKKQVITINKIMRNTDNLTITYLGIDMDIEFAYYPGEDAVMYYPDGSGDPGCGEEVEIYSIYIKGIDIMELLSTKQENEIIELLLESINN